MEATGRTAEAPSTGAADVLRSPVLIGRAQLGDLHALDQLCRALQEPLFRHVHAIPHTAEDVLQEALLTVCRKLRTLRDPRWFRAWAYRIATRLAVRRAKREHRWSDALRDDGLAALPAAEPEPRFDPELVAALPSALSAVSPASQLVLRMHYLDELTCPEIAEALEISVGTVKSRLAYGLAAMRKTFAELPGNSTAG
ncbi:MAG TPA: RNA polymerase sigma factor [Longimicrobium sp.]|nr:RNA polymerase sigma factor [Longimicrobium sp.]